ncbi:MAG: Ig-like domain-containing protein [Deltaproteobacteria bacterium]|jgi:hypothetical protein|nr:Ig-like domain-containing protein [Deltaproteobacteria bacterium]
MKKLTTFLLLGFLVITGMSLSGCASYNELAGSIFSPPAVTMTSPAANETNVSVNATVKASFNEAMNSLSFNSKTFKLYGPEGKVPGKVYYNTNSLTNYIVTFTPDEPLRPNTTYTAELTTGIRANLNDPLKEAYKWRFTTGN